LKTELATWLCALGNLPSTRDLWVFELSAGQVGPTVRLVNELAANALDPALHVCAVAPAVPSADAMAISVVSADHRISSDAISAALTLAAGSSAKEISGARACRR
jgi:hypothetical protein